MSIECGECERDLRGGHDVSCSRYKPPQPCTCGHSERDHDEEGACFECRCFSFRAASPSVSPPTCTHCKGAGGFCNACEGTGLANPDDAPAPPQETRSEAGETLSRTISAKALGLVQGCDDECGLEGYRMHSVACNERRDSLIECVASLESTVARLTVENEGMRELLDDLAKQAEGQ